MLDEQVHCVKIAINMQCDQRQSGSPRAHRETIAAGGELP